MSGKITSQDRLIDIVIGKMAFSENSKFKIEIRIRIIKQKNV